MTEPDGERLLAPLRDVPVPAPGVGVVDGLRAGRRSVRARRLLGAVSTLVAVVLVVAAGPALVRALISPPDVVPPADGVHGFDPMRRVADLGSVNGFLPVSYQTGRYRQRAVLRMTAAADTVTTLTLYPSDAAPPIDHSHRADPVDGRAAYWLATHDRTRLAWRLASGVWAVADLDRTGGDWRLWIERLAGQVRSADVPVRVPFTVSRRATAALGTFDGVLLAVGPDTGRYGALVFRPAGRGADVYVGVQHDPDNGPLVADPLPTLGVPVGHRVASVDRDRALLTDLRDGYAALAVRGGPVAPTPDDSPPGAYPGGSGMPASPNPSPSETSGTATGPVGPRRGGQASDDAATPPADDPLLAAAASVRLVALATQPSTWTGRPFRP